MIGNNIGDAGLIALAKAVESGALAQLIRLDMDKNQIGDAGLAALAKAVESGTLASLETIVVDERHPDLVAVCQPRGIAII